jgi:mono/diheme cytochrome c family protein
MREFRKREILLSLLLVSIPLLPAPAAAEEALIQAGKRVYEQHCIGCHGEKGDGKGRAAALLVVKPRDFSTGIIEFKSTPPGSLATDDDLMRTITRGLPGNSMPSFELLPERERRAVIAYIKTFSERWKKEVPPPPIPIPAVPDWFGTAEAIQKGKEVYQKNGCPICHGVEGDGKGPAAPALRDVWGNPDPPRNFKRGIYEGGSSPKDLFRTLTTGIEGTPMQAFPQIPEEERWQLISYLLSLKKGG